MSKRLSDEMDELEVKKSKFLNSKISEKHCSLDSLPYELLEHVLNFDVVSYIDICRISCVSQFLNYVSKSNKIWHKKYAKMWPSMVKLFDPINSDWKEEFKLLIKYRRVLHSKLHGMLGEYYYFDNVSNDAFFDFQKICDNHPFTDYILLAELGRIVHDSKKNLNLTMKYYGEKALKYIRHKMLDTVWHDFLNDKPRPSLLKGACLIQQWCEPTKIGCTKQVTQKMNAIVEQVFNEVKVVCPSHPVIKRGYLPVVDDKEEFLDKSLWSPHQCKVILICINTVLYSKLKLSCVEHLGSADSIYVDKVIDMKVGIPVTQGVIYLTLASQLGVHLLPVNFPGHFLLKWLEHPNRSGEDAWTYIDVFEAGALKNKSDLDDLAPGYDHFSHSWLDPVPPLKVFARMCWNLVEIGRQHDGFGVGLMCLCNSLELLSILSPDDMEHKLLLARVYMHLNVNISRVLSLLQEVEDNDPGSTGIVGFMYRSATTMLETQRITKLEKKIIYHSRNEETKKVNFAVGMLMTHKKYNYRCVIYGWDPICAASKDWINQMGVNQLPDKDQQPFYHVLVSDGTDRYAAQENLQIDCIEEPIKHIEIGRYFESFHGNYYMPNEQKQLEYPDDLDVLKQILSQAKVAIATPSPQECQHEC